MPIILKISGSFPSIQFSLNRWKSTILWTFQVLETRVKRTATTSITCRIFSTSQVSLKHFQDSLMTRKMIKEQRRRPILSEQQGAESSSDALWGVTNSAKGSRMKGKETQRENVISSWLYFGKLLFAGVKDESRSSECLRPCTHPPQHPGYGSEQFGYPCFLPQHSAPPPTRFSPPRDAPFFNFSQQPFRWVVAERGCVNHTR